MKLDISKSNKIYDTKNVEHLYKPEIIELVRLFTNVFGDRKCLINESRMIFTSKKSNVTMLQRFNFGPFCVPLNGQSLVATGGRRGAGPGLMVAEKLEVVLRTSTAQNIIFSRYSSIEYIVDISANL